MSSFIQLAYNENELPWPNTNPVGCSSAVFIKLHHRAIKLVKKTTQGHVYLNFSVF